MRILRVVAALGVAAGLAATPSTGVVGSSPNFDLGPSAKVAGAAPLANFQAKGDNLVRLLAGAFDPAAGPLPAGSGIGLRDRSTLPADTPQYWLVQVRDQRYADVVSAVSQRRRTDRRHGSRRDTTWCARRRHSATQSRPTRQFAGPATTSRRGASRSQPADKPGLLELSGKQRYRVHVFSDDPASGAVGRALKQMNGVKVLQDAGVVVDVEATQGRAPGNRSSPGRGVDRHPAADRSPQLQRALGQRHRRSRPLRGDRPRAPERRRPDRLGRRHRRQLQARPERSRSRQLPRLQLRRVSARRPIYTQTAPGNTPAQMEGVSEQRDRASQDGRLLRPRQRGPEHVRRVVPRDAHRGLGRRRQAAVRHLAER